MIHTLYNFFMLRIFLIFLFSLSDCVYGNVILLNSSYDTGRDLFAVINSSFIRYWNENHPKDHLVIRQSHSGSTKQAMSVLKGLSADVVTYNQMSDIQILCDQGKLIARDWQSRLPNNSSPFYSTIAFVVRKGNPKGICDWSDLISNIKIILPNPKTSGNGRYIYLAAWNASSKISNFNKVDIRSWMLKFLNNVLIFDIGSRSATATFIDRMQGDVLITFESEANTICRQYGAENYEIIVPMENILAEFPVAWIDSNINKRGTEEVAKAYLHYLYTYDAQNIIASFFYRVNVSSVMDKYRDQFPNVQLFRVEDQFGDWKKVMYVHFSRGGELDKLLAMRYSN